MFSSAQPLLSLSGNEAAQSRQFGHLLLAASVICIAVMAITGALAHSDPAHSFHEKGLARYLSALQLVATGCLAFVIYRARRQTSGGLSLMAPRTIWLLIGAGFIFLAADDVFKIHENADRSLHTIFGIEETGWSDRLDDLIILFYMVIGIAVMWFYRAEMLKFRSVMPVLMVAMVLAVAMIAVDVLTNRDDVLLWLLNDTEVVHLAATWAVVFEESLKLLAEAVFIIAAYRCLLLARRPLASV